LKIRSRFLTKLFAVMAVLTIRLLFRTCRVRVETAEPGSSPYEPTGQRRYLYSIWHDQLLMTIFCGRPQQMAGLVSAHQDGSYLAHAMNLVNIRAVRGSTNRGGDRALREMLDAVADWHVAITPDGPRGPRRVAKPGIIFLASRTGRAIIPAAHVCRRSWRIPGSWTDMLLPKPFTRVLAIGGPPFHVPPDADRGTLNHYAQLLTAEMERLEGVALRRLSGEKESASDTRTAA
jgi:lysophospholipid acyltransferase (LPLAT)-like uncharacterized protein